MNVELLGVREGRTLLKRAYILAETTHHGQEYNNLPYMYHVVAVAAPLVGYGFETQIVALLHDAGEHCANLQTYGFTALIADAVELLTRKPDTDDYITDYIQRIAEGDTYAHNIAQVVKLSDLRVNLSHFPYGPKADRYRYALEIINKARYERGLGGIGR